MDSLLLILSITIYELVSLFGFIIIFGFVLGILRKKTLGNLYSAFGKNIIYITGIIGTPIHEVGHAIMCLIFTHKVKKIKLFNFNGGDILGYVNHSYNKNNLYQRIGNLFIAIGPIFSGIFVIFITLYVFVPDSFKFFFEYYSKSINSETLILSTEYFKTFGNFTLDFLSTILSKINTLGFWIFFIICFSVSLHMSLSRKDMEGFIDGFISLTVLLLVLNSFLVIIGYDSTKLIASLFLTNIYIISFLLISLIFSFISFFIGLIINKIF
ncbi:MAG: hypothetical protein ABF289_20610 [Clostridiales bacterium]